MASDALHKVVDAVSSTVSQATTATQETASEAKSEVAQAFGSPDKTVSEELRFFRGAIAGTPITPASPTTPNLAATGAGQASDVAPPSPVLATPPASIPFPSIAGEGTHGDYDDFIRDTLLWVNKVRSVVYLLGGLLAIFLAFKISTIRTSAVTAIAWTLLAQLGFNSLRGFISPKLQERATWADAVLTDHIVSRLAALVRGGAVLHDKYLLGLAPGRTLNIIAILWAVSLAGRAVGAIGLATALWIVAFTLPKAYTVKKAQVDQVVADVTAQVKSRFLALDPRARAAAVVVPVFVAGYALSRADLAIALLALAVYGRSQMAPAQVERLNSVVAPVVHNTVTKVSNTVSKLVSSAATKYDLTPTPSKAKRA